MAEVADPNMALKAMNMWGLGTMRLTWQLRHPGTHQQVQAELLCRVLPLEAARCALRVAGR